MKSFSIRVPATTANLGVGFDTLGLAFRLYLEVHGEITDSPTPHFDMHYEGEGNVSSDPKSNLLLQAALHAHHRIHHGGHGPIELPHYTNHADLLPGSGKSLRLRVVNPIPLSRGLGSSACAIVAGVLLGNVLNNQPMTHDQLMDAILEIEGHPDNVTASFYGGLTCSYLRANEERQTASGGMRPQCVCVRHRLHPQIRCVAVIPDFELSTSKARQVLPTSFSRADTIYTMQRLSVLLSCITVRNNAESSATDLDPYVVFEAFRDRLHQPYRMPLIPGLERILTTLSPDKLPGLLGITLSGAGPTVLAFCCTGSESSVAESIQAVFRESSVSSRILPLELDTEGSIVTCHT